LAVIDAILTVRNRRPEKAKQAFNEMIEAGIRPNEKTFGALIDAWVRAGDFEESFKIVELMKQNDVRITGVLALGLLQISQYARRIDGALFVWNELAIAQVKPFRPLYILMINTLVNAGELPFALDIAEDGIRQGVVSPCDREMKASCFPLMTMAREAGSESCIQRANALLRRFTVASE